MIIKINNMQVLSAKKKVVKKQSVVSSKSSKPTHFYLRILSRHPSSRGLRNSVPIKGKKVVYRHGSTTTSALPYEINSIKSIKTSADKKLMKEAFDRAGISHALWLPLSKAKEDKGTFDAMLKKLEFGTDKKSYLIIKSRMGSRGNGNTLVKTKAELDAFLKRNAGSLGNYIVEEYKNYSCEYRIHVTARGYFYTCRKMLKKGTPDDKKFQRHDDNCTWYIESNANFNKPANWNEIVEDCKKALVAIGADVLGFDVKSTSVKDVKDKKAKWIIIESCSAPSFGTGTLTKYKEELPKIVNHKYNS